MWSAARSIAGLVVAAIVVALPARAAESSRAVQLLEEEESVVQASLVKLETWCKDEMGSQEKQRGELLKLKAALASEADTDVDPVATPSRPKPQAKAAASLLSTGSRAKGVDLDLQVKSLKDAQKELEAQSAGFWFFSSPAMRGLHAVQNVLGTLEADRTKEQHESTIVQSMPETDLHEDESTLPTSQLSELAAQHAKKLAASRGQQVLDTAVSKAEVALSEAASICGIGRSVLGRVELQSRSLREHAIELIGRVEGAQGAAATAVAPASNTSDSSKSNQDSQLVRDLLRQLQQQQALQQQNFQQRPIMDATFGMQPAQLYPRPDLQELLQELRLQLSPQVQAPQYVLQPQQQFLQPQPQPQQMQQMQLQQPILQLQPQLQQLQPQQAPLQVQPQPQPQPQWQQAQLQQPQLQQAPQQQVQPQQSLLAQTQQTKPQQLMQVHQEPKLPEPQPSLQEDFLLGSSADSSPSSLLSKSPPAAELSLASIAPPATHAKKERPAATNRLEMSVGGPSKEVGGPTPTVGAKAKQQTHQETSLADEAQEMLKAEDAVEAKKTEKQPPSDSVAEVRPHVQKTTAEDAESSSPMQEEKAADSSSGMPASLRGGWQAVLAKKRTENKAKTKPSTQVSAIMQLMQTPKTYTAWQPDAAASDAKLAATAKSELLAAEKAFDSDDDDADSKTSGVAKSSTGRSLLQMDGGLGINQLEDELGGSDPLAFFQLGSSAYTAPRLFGQKSDAGADVTKVVLESFAHRLGSQSLSELAGAGLGLEGLERLEHQQSLSFDEAETKRDLQAEKRCRAFQEQHVKSLQLAVAEQERASAAKAEARAEVVVLNREMAARERLVKAFGRGSKSLLSLKTQLSNEVNLASKLLRQAEQETSKLPVGAAPAVMSELQATLSRLETTGTGGQAELEDAITAAVARRSQAEDADEKSLAGLRAQVREMEHKAKGISQKNKKAKNDEAASGMQELCDSTLADIEARRAKRDGERLAVGSALAVVREMLGH